METPQKKSRKGFASMSRERHRLVSAKGGKKAQQSGRITSHWTPEEARIYGSLGGMRSKRGPARPKMPAVI
jgi:hypothetical protein